LSIRLRLQNGTPRPVPLKTRAKEANSRSARRRRPAGCPPQKPREGSQSPPVVQTRGRGPKPRFRRERTQRGGWGNRRSLVVTRACNANQCDRRGANEPNRKAPPALQGRSSQAAFGRERTQSAPRGADADNRPYRCPREGLDRPGVIARCGRRPRNRAIEAKPSGRRKRPRMPTSTVGARPKPRDRSQTGRGGGPGPRGFGIWRRQESGGS